MNTITQTFYAEFTNDPKTWASPRPAFDVEGFNRELERVCGRIGSVPRMRLRWAGELDEYVIEEGYKVTGYSWVESGEQRFVSCLNADFEFPDNAMITPVFENVKVFTPRWVIEEFDDGWYRKAWFIETLEKIGEENGRIDVLSRYRQPATIDLNMAQHLSYQREHLNADDIRNGLAREAAKAAADKKRRHDEFVDYVAEETAKALTDGLPNPVHFDINHKFDIREYSRKKLSVGACSNQDL